MRDHAAILVSISCTLLIVGFSDVEVSMRLWRFVLAGEQPSILHDIGLALLSLPPGFLHDPEGWFWIGSYGGWLACYIALSPMPRRGRIALLVSPVPMLLAVSGLGIALLGLTIFFGVLTRLARTRSAADVPSLGLALLVVAWTVPQFEVLFLAAASSLVLIAPRDMLRQNMAAFYIVTIAPALLLMTAKAGFDGGILLREWPADPALYAAAPPVVLGLLSISVGKTGAAKSVSAIALCIAAAAVLSQAIEPFFALALAGLAAAYAARQRGSIGLEIAQSVAIALAAIAYHGHIAGLWLMMLSKTSQVALIG
ncbi:MAG: hypothetical protein AAF830_05770 [Pseudomonadota bacterium]